MSEKEENKIEKEFDATNPDVHHQSKLMQFIMSDEQATVQSLIGGDPDEPEFVRHYTDEITYETYRLRGIEAKISEETFSTMPEKLEKMQSAATENGKQKYTKDDVKKFIRAWCFNKCRAVKDIMATPEDFLKMAEFVEDIVFGRDEKKRAKPAKAFKKSTSLSKYYIWETKKFLVKTSVDSYVGLEEQVRKLKKRAKKDDSINVVAETKKVVFLQKNMRLIAGQYCSGAEYAAYYKEIFKGMYPIAFGSDKGLKKDEKGIHPEQSTVEKDPVKKKEEAPKKKKGKTTKKKS